MADDLPSVEPSPHCRLSLTQVDAASWCAHRIGLWGNLIARLLEGEAPNEWIEELLELVSMMIADAAAITAVIKQGCQTATRAA